MKAIATQGGCLCGKVRYEIRGELRQVIACHCEQCRRSSGHFVAASACLNKELKFLADRSLAWYQSSESARRGFCRECGSSLFWQHEQRESTSIMAGTIDTPTGLHISHHIFVADASDYYAIKDGLPQFPHDAGDEKGQLDTYAVRATCHE